MEVLSQILEDVAEANTRDGATYTYGLSRAPLSMSPMISQRYVRGPLSPDLLRWDVSSVLRCVCWKWHNWALRYALRELYIRQWRGSERWVDLPTKRSFYPLYELIDRPTGTAVYRNPFATLQQTASICNDFSEFASIITRVWVHGFYTAETVQLVYESLKRCDNLSSLSFPWTAIRYLGYESWQKLLTGRKNELRSLELQCVEPTFQQIADQKNWINLDPLRSVNFSCLYRLKIFGNTSHMPITDSDIFAIADTATGLGEFYLTCNSSTTIDSVVAATTASAKTLRVLEHSPRSQNGFWHPHPGSPNGGSQHYCEMLRNLSKLNTLSISLPSICADLFSSNFGRLSGNLQVRAFHVCEHEGSRWTLGMTEAIQKLLHQARVLIEHCSQGVAQGDLYVELFFAGYIFEPGTRSVHGDFLVAQRRSGGRWSPTAVPSSKGPYGRTGVYGADEGIAFQRIEEEDFLCGYEWLPTL
ncbi:hypothetical protein Alg130_10633 [Pyrenophora tritici-repentis]|nr:hypothetical protein Alg130_10633 [Pyrenophora tritici-repentis]